MNAEGTRDWYDVLGVPPNAKPEAIKGAYRQLAKQRHPDAGGSSAAMQELNAAYDILSDPRRRAIYDRHRRRGSRTSQEQAHTSSPREQTESRSADAKDRIPVLDPEQRVLAVGHGAVIETPWLHLGLLAWLQLPQMGVGAFVVRNVSDRIIGVDTRHWTAIAAGFQYTGESLTVPLRRLPSGWYLHTDVYPSAAARCLVGFAIPEGDLPQRLIGRVLIFDPGATSGIVRGYAEWDEPWAQWVAP